MTEEDNLSNVLSDTQRGAMFGSFTAIDDAIKTGWIKDEFLEDARKRSEGLKDILFKK